MKISKSLFLILFLSLVALGTAQEQTTDGGTIIAGTTMSYTTDTLGNWSDIIVYKVNGSGTVTWFDHYGGVMWEEAAAVRQTADGGYIVLGIGDSFSFPNPNTVLFKLDAGGAVAWRSDFGIDWGTIGLDIRQTADGGYVVAGGTFPMYGLADIFLVKLDAAGNKQWQKSFGGSLWDFTASIDLTADGGYILAGGGDSFTHGQNDFLLYKLNASGNKQWRKNYGGIESDWAMSVQQTTDGGYIAAGSSGSYVHGSTGFPFGDSDFLVYKLDASGNKQWRKNFGGVYSESCKSMMQTTDGGYILAGSTGSFVHGSTGMMFGDRDLLVYKLNAAGNKQWRKNYGGTAPEYGGFINLTADGGYILYGETMSYTHGVSWSGPFSPSDSDLILYKLDSAGNKQWRKNYGGTEPEWSLED